MSMFCYQCQEATKGIGCDGRMKPREYYTEFTKKLPADTIILTAGCAKYRYNKLGLGDICSAFLFHSQ